jgi:hypothetical protein
MILTGHHNSAANFQAPEYETKNNQKYKYPAHRNGNTNRNIECLHYECSDYTHYPYQNEKRRELRGYAYPYPVSRRPRKFTILAVWASGEEYD